MNVGILGSGVVARTLAGGFITHGHQVMLGTRHPANLEQWQETHPAAKVGSVADAALFGELVVLSVKGTAAMSVIQDANPAALAGKTVIDTTNPIADAPPINGVLQYYTTLDDSQLERLQREFSAVRFVKAFNSVGNALMVNPQLPGGKPTMFICGNDAASKKTVSSVLEQFGWGVADMGMAEAARAIEPLCMLWCIPGFLRDDWSHAFKMLQAG